jgi:hypothetical protein
LRTTHMTDKKVHPEDYIAIPNAKSFLINGFRLFFRSLDFLMTTIRKSVVLLVIGMVAGGLVGVILHLLTSKNFSVSMSVQYTTLDKRAYTDILDQMETLIKSRSYETLASDLRVSPSIIENINTVDGATMDNLPLRKDTTSYPFFKIVLGLKSPYGVDSLEGALVNYFNGLPYLKKKKEGEIRVYREQLDYIDSETVKIDSLKKAYTRSLNTTRPVSGVFINGFDPSNIYHQSYQLDTMRASINAWLNDRSQPILLVKGFRATKTPQSISRSASIVVCILAGFLIALIFSLLTEVNKKINGA